MTSKYDHDHMRNYSIAWKQVSSVSFFYLIKKAAVQIGWEHNAFDIMRGVASVPYTVHPPLARMLQTSF